MKTIEAARGRWEEIYKKYDLEINTRKHVECPMCSRKTGLRITNEYGMGDAICVCGHHTGVDIISALDGIDSVSALRRIDEIIGNDFGREDITLKPVDTRQGDAIKLFKTSSHISGSCGMHYLNGRGINMMPEGGVKYLPNVGLISLASDPYGRAVYKHITYLDGAQKRPGKSKICYGLTDNGAAASVAVKLFPVAEVLAIAEGIESALAYRQLEGVNVWSTLNSGNMSKFRAPTGVKHLIIVVDYDMHSATGHKAAYSCAFANLNSQDNDIETITIFEELAGDSNDRLLNGGETRRLVFKKRKER